MLVYATVMMVVLLGFCGLAIDSERAELRMVQLQAIADDAAMTAAAEYQRGNTGWATAAANEATAAGSLNGLTGLTTAASQGTASGPYAGDYSTIQVTVTAQLNLTMLAVLKQGSTTGLTARAVAMVPPCSYFMATSGFSMKLSSAGFSTTCPIYNNSALSNDYFSSFYTGQAKVTGSSALTYNPGRFSPALLYNAPAISDPLAYVTAPTFSSCTYFVALSVLIPTTLNPGTYCGGITAVATTLYLNPGLYIFTGGSTFAGTTVIGNGVTLYFTKSSLFGYGTVNFSNATINLTAPTDASNGGIPGVVIFGDRNWVGGATDFSFNNSTYYGDGIIYTSNTGVGVGYGSMSAPNYFGLVTNFLYEYQANVRPSANYATLAGGSPFRVPVRLVQ